MRLAKNEETRKWCFCKFRVSRGIIGMLIAVLGSMLFVSSTVVWGRGGRGSGGHGGGSYRGGDRSSGMSQPASEAGFQMHQRQRIQATKQQRSQYRTCLQSAERVRFRARDMIQAAKGKSFNSEQAQQHRKEFRNEIQTMEQHHKQFVEGLSQEQKAHIRERLRNMDRARERVNAHFQMMDQELNRVEFNDKGVVTQAGEIEKAMQAWNQQYQKVGSDLGV